MKLFLDANVLFTAAHNPKGKSAFVIELSGKKHWNIVTCVLALEEASRNLEAKFPSTQRELKRLMQLIEVVPTTVQGECAISLPEKDRPIFLSAIASQCSHLLTGDLKDFGRYMNQRTRTSGILIQTVGEFLNTA